jgi:hypothetical protein
MVSSICGQMMAACFTVAYFVNCQPEMEVTGHEIRTVGRMDYNLLTVVV